MAIKERPPDPQAYISELQCAHHVLTCCSCCCAAIVKPKAGPSGEVYSEEDWNTEVDESAQGADAYRYSKVTVQAFPCSIATMICCDALGVAVAVTVTTLCCEAL